MDGPGSAGVPRKREQEHADKGVAFVGVEGEGRVPVDRLVGQRPRRIPGWRMLSVRDWRMSTKLAALVLVPTVVAVLLGAIGITAARPGGGAGGSVAALVCVALVLTV